MSNRNESKHTDHHAETQDTYHFSFDASATRVLAMTETDDGRLKNKSLQGWKFDVKTDADGDAVAVSRTQTQRGVVKTERYEDADGDGAFVETFSSEVLTATASILRADKARFTLDSQGKVLTMQELSKGRWKTEHLDLDERLETMAIDGLKYVVKVELDDNATEWNLYRDDNGDGIWTEVAQIESSTTDSLVKLVGLSDLLALSVGVVG